jgi:hypothetical protein
MLLEDAGLDPQASRRSSLLASALSTRTLLVQITMSGRLTDRKLLKHDDILSVGTLGPWVGLGIRP